MEWRHTDTADLVLTASYDDLVSGWSSITVADIIDAAESLIPPMFRFSPWLHPELDHGRAVLTSEDGLNCYMAAYGAMHWQKMRLLLRQFPTAALTDGFDVVDWGCGQGLATLCLLERLHSIGFSTEPGRVTLIDASAKALHRAERHVRSWLGQDADIQAVEARLPAPGEGTDFPWRERLRGAKTIIHLVSNILDLPGISHAGLAREITSSDGTGYVVCTGYYWTPAYSEAFSRHFLRDGIELMYALTERNIGQHSNGHPFSGDLRLFRCRGWTRRYALAA